MSAHPGTGARVLGADVAAGSWVGVVLSLGTAQDRRALGGTAPPPVHLVAAPGIADLVAAASADGPLSAVALDIPIGLPDAAPRDADLLARAALGPRAPTVFVTPVRAALLAPDHAAAVAASREATGAGVSVQAYRLAAKVLEVDAWVRGCGLDVVEAHPELAFVALAQQVGSRVGVAAPLPRKTTWAGARARLALLRGAGLDPQRATGGAGAAAVDDVLDAAAVAWTAARRARGRAVSRPDPPQVHADGWPAAIWT